MDCYICKNRSTPDRGLHCPVCARNFLYPLRLEHAKMLLDKDMVHRQVQELLEEPQSEAGHDTTRNTAVASEEERQLQHDHARQELARGQQRVAAVMEQTELLCEQIEAYKTGLETRRAAIAAKRANLNSATAALSSLRSNAITPVKKTIKKHSQRHLSLAQEMVSARAYLCTEVASLYGLRRNPGQIAANARGAIYTLGNVPIIDLRDLNEHAPGQISAALANVSHLLFLVCYYLGVRLPAELVIAGEQRPFPSIHQIPTSYKDKPAPERPIVSAKDAGLFGLTSVHHAQLPASPSRILSPEHKLPILAREDPNAYVKFVQSAVLLAWNIAWLCRTQGLDVAADDWEDVCAIGQNLWQLLNSTSSASVRSMHGPTPTRGDSLATPSSRTTYTPTSSTSLGLLSHATCRGFLSSSSASTGQAPELLTKPWKFASPILVMDKLKSFLMTEMSGLEWELLDQKELKGVEGFADDLPMLLDDSGPRRSTAVTALDDGIYEGDQGDTRVKGTSGWTKLKSRPSL